MKHMDCHIHIEQGEYTNEWIEKFVDVAVSRNIDEIWLLEHCYRFSEFIPMYQSVCAHSAYINAWFHKRSGVHGLDDFLRLMESTRQKSYPVKIKFGLEVCYFKPFEDFVYRLTKDKGLDFLHGSIHYIDDFAYDHQPEHWDGVDVDDAYRRYFELSMELVHSGIYTGIAHPDRIKLFGHKPSYSLLDAYDRLAAALAKNRMYAEQSSRGYQRFPATCELGLNEDFISALKRHGVRIQTASDAHCPEDVGLYVRELEEKLGRVKESA